MRRSVGAVSACTVAIAALLVGVSQGASAVSGSSRPDDGTWATRVPADIISGEPDAITCLSERFCVLADDYGAILVEQGGRWQTSYRLPAHDLLVNDISCASRNFCVATGQNWRGETGFVMTYDGSSWSRPDFLAPSTSMVGVSCVSTTWCMAIDYHANSYVYNGASWSAAQPIGDATYVDRIACVTTTFCVVLDDLGGPWMYDGSGWTFAGYGGRYLGYDLQCLSTTWCVVTTTYGVRVWDGTQWTYGDQFSGEPLFSASCATRTSCLAVDEYGGTYRYDGTSWSSAGSVPESNPVVVRCLPDQTCYETGWSGYVYRYRNGSWR